uniref:Uncharacterized protein n=1 Tax=Anguilla anguilla TaxID=7936 RepID=A0A0E9PNE9_ANGAN
MTLIGHFFAVALYANLLQLQVRVLADEASGHLLKAGRFSTALVQLCSRSSTLS